MKICMGFPSHTTSSLGVNIINPIMLYTWIDLLYSNYIPQYSKDVFCFWNWGLTQLHWLKFNVLSSPKKSTLGFFFGCCVLDLIFFPLWNVIPYFGVYLLRNAFLQDTFPLRHLHRESDESWFRALHPTNCSLLQQILHLGNMGFGLSGRHCCDAYGRSAAKGR